MIRTVIAHRCLLILLVLNLTGSAQKTVTLSEAYQIGLENNLALQKQQVSTQQSEVDQRINKTLYFPEVQVGGGYNYVSEVASIELPAPLSNSIGSIEAGVKDQYDLNLQVTQPLFTGFRTRHLVKASMARVEAQRISESAIRNNLLLQIGRMYYQIQSNLLNQEALAAAIQRIDQRLQQSKNFYHAGQLAPYDTLESANRKLQQETQLQSLRYAEQVLQQQFRDLLNTSDNITVVLEKMEDMTTPIDLSSDNSIATRAEIRQLNYLITAQQHSVGAMKSGYFPQIFAAASFHYARPGVNFFRDQWMDYYTLGINFRWTLWNWRRDNYKVRQARLGVRQTELQQQELKQRIETEVTTATQSLQAALDLVGAQQKLLRREEERYRISEEQFRQNQISSVDLNDAENDLTTATLLLQQYLVQARVWQLQLDHATGMLEKSAGE